MLHYALVFLVVGLIAAALGLSGVAGIATQISWILFVIAIVLFVIHLVSGRRSPPVVPHSAASPNVTPTLMLVVPSSGLRTGQADQMVDSEFTF